MVGADEIVNSFHFPIVAYAEMFSQTWIVLDIRTVFGFLFSSLITEEDLVFEHCNSILNVQRHIENPAKSLK